MLPLVTPAEMNAIDAAAPEPVEELIERAGAAVARSALRLLGGAYGRRVVVVAGTGNNGADGRAAARRLERRGVRTRVIDVAEAPAVLPHADLVIDAAFGTGFRGTWQAPELADPATPVLAVDLPSALSADTGERRGEPLRATHTVTFAALKPGHVLGDGPEWCGTIELADIGLDVTGARAGVVTACDVAGVLPRRRVDAHKWRHAVWAIAGSPTMRGAASLVASAALRAGAGYVRRSTPGIGLDDLTAGRARFGSPIEAVDAPVPADWGRALGEEAARFGALAIGPGLGTDPTVIDQVRAALAAPVPIVVDGDGLRALSIDAPPPGQESSAPRLVCTPHEGEFLRLGGRLEDDRDGARPDAPNRIDAVRAVAARLAAVVLLKGPTTVVAHPDGTVALVTIGDERLATAGTGDILTGIVAALLAGGASPFDAAWSGAWIHAAAGRLGPRRGLIASDLCERIAPVLDELGAVAAEASTAAGERSGRIVTVPSAVEPLRSR